jgi:hypothetical protein
LIGLILKLFPLSVLFVKRISAFPGLSSSHATKIWFLDMVKAGSKDPLVLLLRFTGLLKVSPPSVLFVKKMSAFPGLSSSHTTKMSFFSSLNTSGSDEFPLFLLKFMGLSLNVFPPSVLFFNNMSKLPVELSSHTTYEVFP